MFERAILMFSKESIAKLLRIFLRSMLVTPSASNTPLEKLWKIWFSLERICKESIFSILKENPTFTISVLWSLNCIKKECTNIPKKPMIIYKSEKNKDLSSKEYKT